VTGQDNDGDGLAEVAARPCTLSVVVPTRNEALNVGPLAARLQAALSQTAGGWELIFVDDSDDNTPEVVGRLADAVGVVSPVRLLHRPRGMRSGGLGGAVRDGFGVARGRVVAVMDADLQHPPEVLPALIAPVLSGEEPVWLGGRRRGAVEPVAAPCFGGLPMARAPVGPEQQALAGPLERTVRPAALIARQR
jgi:glycosyltransferase involved in cell wall biosynthesis